MSAILEVPVNLAGSSEFIETSTGRKIKEASAVRWVWQCFKDIKLFDNLGAAMLNSLTLAAKPVEILKRCQPYPLTNCEYEVSLHEVKRYGNFGESLDETLPASYSGRSPNSSGAPPHVIESKFAYSCARELSEMYAKEFGLVVLEPLTGNEDSNVVRQVFEMLQPLTYRLGNLRDELTVGADERMRKSTYPKEIKALAKTCRDLMVKGMTAALATGNAHHGELSLNIQNASAGRKGRTRIWPHDEFIAEQLGIEVPRVVQTEKKSTKSDDLLERLAERELARGDENAALMAVLAKRDEEMRELKASVAKLTAAQEKVA